MEFLENITPRKYQQEIFEKCIEKNCLIVLPTGLGKTLIALMLAIERMKQFPGEKILFLAPTKPLVEQHLVYFKKHLPELFAEINLFTGQINAAARKKLWQNTDIIFSTPQCIANDLKKGLYNLKDVCLLVEDEAHRCLKNYDYNFVAHKYKEQSKHQRIIGMTASPGYEKSKINEICRNLSIEEVELKTRDSEDVKPYLQELEFEKKLIDFPEELGNIRENLKKIFDSYIEEIKMRGVFLQIPSKIGLIELQKKLMNSTPNGNRNYNHFFAISACAIAIKLQHALELLETQTLASFNEYLKELFKQAVEKKSKGIVKLIGNPRFSSIYVKSNQLLAKGFEHPKIEELIKIIDAEKTKNEKTKIIIFTQFRDTASVISNKLNQIQGIVSKVFVGQAKKISRGESTGLNQQEQKRIIQEFSSGEINILCATSIAEEGLDIPEVNMVIFYESVPSAIRKIQRGGRTARLVAGKLVMLITRGTRDESFYYIANARERKMHKSIQDIQDDFKNNIHTKTEVQETL